ncbi:lysine N(6)-hydroxylase/L-ornithine N(5)-oxygenase family protein [Streptoalloteichus hindustanus]|uniref:L-lysine N6-monooxygenase MbtG n=1 Tax=Streptoalloteichus hindustanus TaxID=2017 RepID=A0A1M5AAL1_STRHI|nr:SidA/IucD/PvdA family monooxygenase [Streptoalloteichus hindustanus]SHF27194.1 L-ornithine N5-oxygenase [Streptoalloteichus hindustanus]
MSRPESPPYDVVGIGFGPANLALAIAVEEHNRQAPRHDELRALFLERQPRFGWHRGMLLPGTTMQVSFLKDLTTMRDPASRFSFLAYLHERGRLADFVNHKALFPSRLEFHDYLVWAAGQLAHLVEYDREVVDVRPVERDGVVDSVDVVARAADGTLTTRRARNVVVAAGLRPFLPPDLPNSDRIWHNCDLLPRLESLTARKHPTFVVVGAGQSAAETAQHLHSRFADGHVHAVFARYGYAPADDSAFANRIFDPGAVEHFFEASDDVRRLLWNYHRGTNYSAVDLDLIDELYRREYQEKVRGERRLHVVNASRVVDVRPAEDSVRATVEFLPSGALSVIEADALIFATGYRPVDPLTVLGAVGELCLRDGEGRLRIERDYRAVTVESVAAGIYVQGATEHTHGIGSTLLSNVAVRAGEIVRSLLAAADPAPAPDSTAGPDEVTGPEPRIRARRGVG